MTETNEVRRMGGAIMYLALLIYLLALQGLHVHLLADKVHLEAHIYFAHRL